MTDPIDIQASTIAPPITLNTKRVQALAQLKLFKGLSEMELQAIAPLFMEKSYSAGQIIFSHQDQSSEVFFIVAGSVEATLLAPSGREIAYQTIAAGEMFGEVAAIDMQPRTTHIIALENLSVLMIRNADFRKLLDVYPGVAAMVMQRMAGLIRFLCERVYQFGALDVSCRVKMEILKIADEVGVKNGDTITIPKMLKHQEFANRIATHREAVTKELSRLEKQGIIKREKRDLIILDYQKLQSLT